MGSLLAILSWTTVQTWWILNLSRLDSFIRRLEAQRHFLEFAVAEVKEVDGVIFELGLGNGRTFDHLRELAPEREIFVFEREPQPHPACMPDEKRIFIGDLKDTLPEAALRFVGKVALIHSDIGTGDEIRNLSVARFLSEALPDFLTPNGIIISDQPLSNARLDEVKLCETVPKDRYFAYRIA